MDEQTSQLLELIVQPVFFAQNGKIMWRNSAAAAMIADGTEITALLEQEHFEVLELWDGYRKHKPSGETQRLVFVSRRQGK